MIEVLFSIIATVVAAAICAEAKAWSPAAIRRLTRWAVALLPEHQRERYSEEWAAYLAETPGVLGRLIAAAGFVLAAARITRDRKRSRLQLKRHLSAAMFKVAAKCAYLEIGRGPLATRLSRAVRSFMSIRKFGRIMFVFLKPTFEGERPVTFAVNVMTGFAEMFRESVAAENAAHDKSWNVDPETGNFVEVNPGSPAQIRICRGEPQISTLVLGS